MATSTSVQELSELLDLLKAKGVLRAKLYRGHLNEVEFYVEPQAPTVFSGSAPTEPAPAERQRTQYDEALESLTSGVFRNRQSAVPNGEQGES